MPERPTCPICRKRRPERFCPAKGEKICAVCCGTEREVTLDCPFDCSYLIAAHRYEIEHRKPPTADELPFPDVEFSSDLVYANQPLLATFGYAILRFAAERPAVADHEALLALTTLAETYRTLSSGIYYENPPAEPLANGLYTALSAAVADYKKQVGSRPGIPAVKDGDIFFLIIFLARMARSWTNGRPRARLFLQFLRTQFPDVQPQQQETSRIIAP